MATTRQTKRTAPAPKPAPAPQPKTKKAPALQACGCGCGEQTARRFRPGHDARVPKGATCDRCETTATLAVGKTPACDSHVADVVRTNAAKAANSRVAVRSL